MGERGRDDELAYSKNNQIKDWGAKLNILFMTKMAAKWLKSIPYLLTKTAEKPYPLGPHILI